MDYSEIAEMVMKRLNGIPYFVAEEQVKEAVIDFCQETWVYQTDLTAISVEEDTKEYSLSPPTDMIIIGVLSIRDVDNGDQGYDFAVASDYSTFTISVTPNSDDEFELTPKVVLVPGPDSDEIPDWIYNRWSRGLVAGARALCFAMKDKKWSDPNQAQKNASIYESEKNNAKIMNVYAGYNSARVEMRPW